MNIRILSPLGDRTRFQKLPKLAYTVTICTLVGIDKELGLIAEARGSQLTSGPDMTILDNEVGIRLDLAPWEAIKEHYGKNVIH